MQDIDGVVAYTVEDPEWIANDRSNANLRALRDVWSRLGCAANAVNNIDQPTLDGFGYRGAGAG